MKRYEVLRECLLKIDDSSNVTDVAAPENDSLDKTITMRTLFLSDKPITDEVLDVIWDSIEDMPLSSALTTRVFSVFKPLPRPMRDSAATVRRSLPLAVSFRQDVSHEQKDAQKVSDAIERVRRQLRGKAEENDDEQ